ncbi:Transposase IS4 [Popillia japonica]|uniref:Transposase IS4 n=1 Tax=Popillia japonica TaxID=7064 RepID=A0AAW1LX40_POPJA
MEEDFPNIPPIRFYGRKVIHTLPEAADEIPPMKVLWSKNEEAQDDDNIMESQIPNDVPGFVEVGFGNSVEWCDIDDEPLSRFANKRPRIDEKNPKWEKNKPVYVFSHEIENGATVRLEKVKESLRDCNPVQIFEKLFDIKVFELLTQQTILYSRQKNNHDFFVTLEEMKKFIGILLLSGYHKLPQQRMYWLLDEDLGVEMVSKCMSRNRFLEIKKYLHLCNNDILDKNDKMFKLKLRPLINILNKNFRQLGFFHEKLSVDEAMTGWCAVLPDTATHLKFTVVKIMKKKLRPLINILNKNFRQLGFFHEKLSVDEAMVKYFGHHPAEQFIRGKPVRFGLKDWMVCSSTGYCYAFEVYCGKNNEKREESMGLGANVVISLLEHLENPADHVVYFDNFFTTLSLMNRLTTKGIRATGTIRENRQKKCTIQSSKMMDKQEKGTYGYRFDANNKLLIVKWKDNSVCSMVTNHDFIEPLTYVRRWSRVQNEVVSVKQPLVFQNYNVGMGGVDLNDQATNNYRISIRSKKWWWCLFPHMVNLCMTNSWKIHQACATAEKKNGSA